MVLVKVMPWNFQAENGYKKSPLTYNGDNYSVGKDTMPLKILPLGFLF